MILMEFIKNIVTICFPIPKSVIKREKVKKVPLTFFHPFDHCAVCRPTEKRFGSRCRRIPAMSEGERLKQAQSFVRNDIPATIRKRHFQNFFFHEAVRHQPLRPLRPERTSLQNVADINLVMSGGAKTLLLLHTHHGCCYLFWDTYQYEGKWVENRVPCRIWSVQKIWKIGMIGNK